MTDAVTFLNKVASCKLSAGPRCAYSLISGIRAVSLNVVSTARACTLARAALGDVVVLGIDRHHRLSVAKAAETNAPLRKLTDIALAIGGNLPAPGSVGGGRGE